MSTLVNARNGFGTYVQFKNSTAAGAVAAVAGVLSLSGQKFSRGTIDVTSWGTTDGYEQIIPAGQDTAATVNVSAIFLTTSSMQTDIIYKSFQTQTRSKMVVTIPGLDTSSETQWVFEGYVGSYKLTAPFDDKMTCEFTFEPTGKPTIQDSTGV